MTATGVLPGPETFRAMTDYALVPVARRVFVDAETPLGLYRKLTGVRRGSFLLESADHGSTWSRYSVIGMRSPAVLTEVEGRAVWLGDPPRSVAEVSADPLTAVRETLTALRHPAGQVPAPFTGGLVGYLGHDAVRHPDRPRRRHVGGPELPALALLLVTDVAVIDHSDGSVLLVAGAYPGDDSDDDTVPTDAYDAAVQRLEEMTVALGTRLPPSVSVHDQRAVPHAAVPEPGAFPRALTRAQAHVRDGDCYLITCSQRYDTAAATTGLDAFRLVRATRPGPYLYLLDFGEFQVAGSSLVGQVKVTGRHAFARPVAGIRPRGADADDDSRRAAALLADPVVRAEHLTLVEQARGDLARVCVAGSIRLAQFMEVERGRQAMCLASTVTGELREEGDPLAAVTATFPPAGLTGVPRARARQLVEELDGARRGLYGGSVGYLGFNGDLELAALSGVLVLRDGHACVHSGATVTVGTDLDGVERAAREQAATLLSALAVAETLQPPP